MICSCYLWKLIPFRHLLILRRRCKTTRGSTTIVWTTRFIMILLNWVWYSTHKVERDLDLMGDPEQKLGKAVLYQKWTFSIIFLWDVLEYVACCLDLTSMGFHLFILLVMHKSKKYTSEENKNINAGMNKGPDPYEPTGHKKTHSTTQIVNEINSDYVKKIF